MRDIVELLNEENQFASSYFEGVNEAVQHVNEKILYGSELPFEEVKFYNEKVQKFLSLLEIQLQV